MSDTQTADLSPEQELANAFLGGVEEPVIDVEAAPEAAPEAQPEASAPVEEAAPAAAPEWQPREFTFKRNGEEVRFKPSSPDEEVEFIRKGYDYTAKTMELAEEKKTLQSLAKELADREEARQASLKAFFSNRANIARYLELLDQQGGGAPQQAPAPGEDADFEPISRADLAKLRAEMVREAQAAADAKAEERFKSLLDSAATERLTTEYRSDFDKTIDSLVSRHPELEFVDGVGDLIRQAGSRAFQTQLTLNPDRPVDPALVKAAMEEDAAQRASRVAAKLREREKLEAASRSALTARGVEPPGGNAPTTPAPSQASRPMSLKDPALDAAVIAEIQALIK